MSIMIGVFDSGVGGLSVLKELVNKVKGEYVYIGDTARAPYGNLPKDALLSHTKELLVFLQKKNVDIFISACNSLSTLDIFPLLEELQIDTDKYYDMTMFAKKAKSYIKSDAKLLIYATEATIKSEVYQKIFESFSPHVLTSFGLARAIEDGHEIEIDEEVDTLIDYVFENKITEVFLGCTHYPLIEEYLAKRFFGTGVTFINPATFIPRELVKLTSEKVSLEINVTKVTNRGSDLSEDFFGKVPLLVSL